MLRGWFESSGRENQIAANAPHPSPFAQRVRDIAG